MGFVWLNTRVTSKQSDIGKTSVDGRIPTSDNGYDMVVFETSFRRRIPMSIRRRSSTKPDIDPTLSDHHTTISDVGLTSYNGYVTTRRILYRWYLNFSCCFFWSKRLWSVNLYFIHYETTHAICFVHYIIQKKTQEFTFNFEAWLSSFLIQ